MINYPRPGALGPPCPGTQAAEPGGFYPSGGGVGVLVLDGVWHREMIGGFRLGTGWLRREGAEEDRRGKEPKQAW